MAVYTHAGSYSEDATGPIAWAARTVREHRDRTLDHGLALSLALRVLGWVALFASGATASIVGLLAWNAAWVQTWNGRHFEVMPLIVGVVAGAGVVLAGGFAAVVFAAAGRALELLVRRVEQ